MLNVVMLNVVMLNVVMLNAVMLNAVMLSVMLSVLASSCDFNLPVNIRILHVTNILIAI
jgi:hypothetical protein